MVHKMKSVMIFDPKDGEQETQRKWQAWNQHKSAVGDKYVPTAAQTRKMLHG